MRSLLAVSNGIGHFSPIAETRWQCLRRVGFYLIASYGTIRLTLDATHQLLKWMIP